MTMQPTYDDLINTINDSRNDATDTVMLNDNAMLTNLCNA